MTQVYDEIGVGYGKMRRPDARIAALMRNALGDAESVLNVGAGAGSYEPTDRKVVALEPSATMVAQRAPDAAPVVRGAAEALPFGTASFDACLASLTVHHWSDRGRGLCELGRVARDRVVVFNWDQPKWEQFWLLSEYIPNTEMDRRRAVSTAEIESFLEVEAVIPVPVPHDCTDGFHGAFWRRPEAYLDPKVRASISTFASMKPVEYEDGLRRLEDDLQRGVWQERHRDLLALEELDLGYRLIVAKGRG